jgi:hypothetical protein
MLRKKPMKSDNSARKLFFVQYSVFIFLGIVFLFFSFERPFFDYDAVRNHQILNAFLNGDFSSVFSHLSPLFFLVYWPFYALIERLEVGMWGNGFFLLLHLGQWANYCAKKWGWQSAEKIAFLLFYGTSYFVLYQAQCIAIEPLSLFIFAWLWQESEKESLYTWPLFALLSLVNYKALLLLPFFLGRSLFEGNSRHIQKRFTLLPRAETVVKIIFSVLFTLLFLLALGWLSGAGTLNYFARVYGLFTARAEQSAPLDFFFYPQYLLHFEALLLPVGLVLGLSLSKEFFKQNIFFFCFLVGIFLLMSFLPKAVRGLLFVFPLLYAFAWMGLLRGQKKASFALYFALCINLFFALAQAYTQLHPKGENGAKKMAQCVEERGIKTLKTTTSLQIQPYFKSKIKLQASLIFSPSEKNNYLLFDDYWHAVQAHAPTFPEAEVLCRVSAPELHNPMLFLEHSEFSNRTFDEAMEAWQTHYAPEMRLIHKEE